MKKSQKLFIGGLEAMPHFRLLSPREAKAVKGGATPETTGAGGWTSYSAGGNETLLASTMACGEEPNSGC